MVKLGWIVCLCVVASWSLVHAQGYRMESDRIVVEGEDWKAWDHPKGVLEFDEEGGLHLWFVHKNINAPLDADRFTYRVAPGSIERMRGGPRDAGSNPNDVANVMDGDLSTFWEPDREDPLENWWFVIDLGRLVSATKIVLRFVEEGKGDPFLQFKVGISNGYKWTNSAFVPDKPLFYRTIGRTTQPNESQRVFEFEVSWPLPGLPAIGDIQFVRVMVMQTRGDRKEQISKEEYGRLDMDWRGRIEYYRITAAGREEITDQEGYERLSPEQKGSIKYYRRERPRLVELEIWTVGENLSLGIGDRGGLVEVSGGEGGTGVVDGNVNTWTRLTASRGVEIPRGVLVDLGGVFWVDAVYLLFERASAGYRLRMSDGSVGMEGALAWTQDAERRLPAKLDRIMFPVQKIRYVDFRSMFNSSGMASGFTTIFRLTEIKVYGEGYVPEAILTSEPIEVGRYRHLNSIQWVSDVPPGTSVEIQTRTGDTLEEEKHYFNKDGEEVSEYQWRYKLPGFMKAPIKIKSVPGSDWSPWSHPYEHSGDRFQSPSPKTYLQIRVKLLSDDPYRAASLKSLSIPFTIPLTEAITGTRSPKEVQRLGAPEVFTIKIHPVLQEWHPGFNQLFVQTLDMMEMELVKLEVKKGGRGVIESRPSTDWTDRVEILPTRPDTLWMVLPDTIKAGYTDEITLQFLSALYRDGTVFNVFVGNTVLPEVYQQVESEDYHAYSKTFMVFAPEKNRNMIDNVRLEPSVITPNGDGINDVLTVHFTVGRIQAERPVRLTIYDLSGKKVRHMVEQRPKYPLGKYAMEWDGRDKRGRLVPPGLYLVAIRVKSNWYAAENTEVCRRGYVVY